MDIYRFFHPHHNPRLRRVALRQQELSELGQAAEELVKALERAQERIRKIPRGKLVDAEFEAAMTSLRAGVAELRRLNELHPGDTLHDLAKMIHERSGMTGWDSWSALVTEQVKRGPEGIPERVMLEKENGSSIPPQLVRATPPPGDKVESSS